MKKVNFYATSDVLYPNDLPHDDVYRIVNENDVTIGVIYLSFLEDGSVYIDWLETMIIFHGQGYLRLIFKALREMFPKREISFESDEKNRIKYLHIGCEEHGISELTGLYKMTY